MYEAVWKSFQSEIGSIEKIKPRCNIVWQGEGNQWQFRVKLYIGSFSVDDCLKNLEFYLLAKKATFLEGKQIL